MTSDFGILRADPFVDSNAIVMTALYHEWSREDHVSGFGVVESVARIEFQDFILMGEHIAERLIDACDF